MNDLVNTSRGNTDVLGDSILRNSQGLEEVLKQDLPRVNRRKLSSSHKRVLVIVNDLDVMGVTILPPEAHAALVVDTNTVLATPPTLEFFQAVARRDS